MLKNELFKGKKERKKERKKDTVFFANNQQRLKLWPK